MVWERSTPWITERDTAQTETERVLARLVTAHPWTAVCIKSKRVFAHVIHVLNVSYPLSSRVARTTRRSLSTRTSRMVTEHWLLQVDPRQYGLHIQSTTSAATMGVKRKPPDQTMLVMVTADNLVENMISLKHEVAQT